ncbi:MAG TPA: TonB-dependent receptor plug domain-containing protein, partial [Saprospiraceae bacterium]|nr:TonB-dependent receptor plug domain-containing protein [Saprospiraceae bacterium]
MKRIGLYIFILISVEINAQKSILDTIEVLKEVMIVGEKNQSIPGSGSYINTKRLQKLNQPIINNVLRTIPGVNIRDEEGFGLRPNIGLRGTPVNRSAKVTLMEDGILMAPAPYADPSAYYFPTFARMQGVEVLKGSSQIKYGPYTVGGAVNLISTPIPDAFEGFAQLSYGSFGTNQQRIWLGDSRSNFDYVFEVNRYASNGFKQLDNGGNTGFDRRDVMGKLRWHSDDAAKISQSLTLKFVNTTEDSRETYLGLTFDDYKKNPLRRYAGTQ